MGPIKSLTFLFLLLLSSSILAHPSYKNETVYTPSYYNWTGFYGGLNIGMVNHAMNITDRDATSFLATIQQMSNPKLTGGVQVGYRQQLHLAYASSVYGVELSWNAVNAEFHKEYGSPFALYQLDSKNKLRNLVLLELMGGIAVDRTLLFLSAGAGWLDISGETTNLDTISFFDSFSVNKKVLSIAWGIGLEYAFCERLSARIKLDVITPGTYSVSDNVGDKFDVSNLVVQAVFGLNYKLA